MTDDDLEVVFSEGTGPRELLRILDLRIVEYEARIEELASLKAVVETMAERRLRGVPILPLDVVVSQPPPCPPPAVVPDRGHKSLPERMDEIGAALAAHGPMRVRGIAEAIGTTPQRVQKILKEHGSGRFMRAEDGSWHETCPEPAPTVNGQ